VDSRWFDGALPYSPWRLRTGELYGSARSFVLICPALSTIPNGLTPGSVVGTPVHVLTGSTDSGPGIPVSLVVPDMFAMAMLQLMFRKDDNELANPFANMGG